MPDLEVALDEWVIEVDLIASVVEVNSITIEVIELGGSQGPAGVNGDTALAEHLAALNPHPQYVTRDELAASTSQSAETDSACLVGQPLYLKSNGHLDLAQANLAVTSNVCGLAISDTQPTISAQYLSDGVIERSDWTAIVGSELLSIGTLYYLSPDVAGRLTLIAPTQPGQFVICIGIAITTQKLSIDVQSSVLL